MDQFDRNQRMREFAQIGHERLDRAEQIRNAQAGYVFGEYDAGVSRGRLVLAGLVVIAVLVLMALVIALGDGRQQSAGIGSEDETIDGAGSSNPQTLTLVQPPAWLMLPTTPPAEVTP